MISHFESVIHKSLFDLKHTQFPTSPNDDPSSPSISPEIVDLILHHLPREGEALQALELLHLLVRLDVAALTQQHVLLGDFSRPARQVVLEGGHCALSCEV